MSTNTIKIPVRKETRLIIPFFAGKFDVSSICRKSPEWEKQEINSIFLAKYIKEFFDTKNSANATVCEVFRLTEQARGTRFAAKNDKITLTSSLMAQEECYDFYLKDVKFFVFKTGMCFLVLEVYYGNTESVCNIVNISYNLSRMLMYNSNGEKSLTYACDGRTFSFADAIYSLMDSVFAGKKQDYFDNKQFLIYQRLILSENEKEDISYQTDLQRIRHTAFAKVGNESAREDDFAYSPLENVYWSGNSLGVVSISIDADKSNHKFITEKFAYYVNHDYFYIFMLALHERELLLHYNYDAVKNWNNQRALCGMRKQLVEFNILFAYNIVSEEMAYQMLYEKLYDCFRLEKLENDIQDVIGKVDEYVTSTNDRKTNALLSMLTLLTIFSAFTDSLGLIDRLNQAGLTYAHLVVIGINIVIILIGILLFFRKK